MSAADKPRPVEVIVMPLPCPFCGDNDISVVDGSTFRWRHAICQTCGAQSGEVRVQTIGAGTKDEWEKAADNAAFDKWNERHNASIERLASEKPNKDAKP